MTDEEKAEAEEYARYWIEKDRITFRCDLDKMTQAYLDGRAEERKVIKEEYKFLDLGLYLETMDENEKMKNFIYEEIDFCSYCPQTESCKNDEGTCPYAGISKEEQKKMLMDWIKK